MSGVEVRPFEAADLTACGVLLADRHRRHRIAEPLLSPRFEDIGVATSELAAVVEMADASGAVAFRAGALVGFVLGAPKSSPAWGANMWVEAAGQAATDAEVIRDLYAVAAARWVDTAPEPVGCALEKSSVHLSLARPDNAGLLASAAVFPSARRVGAGRALGEAVIGWAARSGHDRVVIDWRVTNLLASRAWPAIGFAETFLRLHRLVGY